MNQFKEDFMCYMHAINFIGEEFDFQFKDF